jgi:hypothetical protein
MESTGLLFGDLESLQRTLELFTKPYARGRVVNKLEPRER